MGLFTSHGCWMGAYSAFTRWRNKLAEVAGYRIEDVEHDGIITPMPYWEGVDDITYRNLNGLWEETPDDPLIVLIAHYDCEGFIFPMQQMALARRLEELVPLLPDEEDPGHIGHWREKTQKFIDGLKLAHARKEAVRF